MVLLYSMRVTDQAQSWPEKGQRQVRWASALEAASLVDAGLSDLIRCFADTLAPNLDRDIVETEGQRDLPRG
jgi:hypothetical protein